MQNPSPEMRASVEECLRYHSLGIASHHCLEAGDDQAEHEHGHDTAAGRDNNMRAAST